jgi:hypothetical protein
MESHDEERLMYKNLQFGNSSGNYNIRSLPIAIQRIKLAGAFYFTIPGPKMIWQFGELGYDYSINYPCMTEACRLDPKPIRWDYFDDGNRRNLYKVLKALIDLRQYETFNSSTYTYNLNSYLKRISISDSTMNVNIIGNFYVNQLNINPEFPSLGRWYDYFSGDSIFVTNSQTEIPLQAGEFHIYTTVKLPTPEPGILLGVESIDEQTLPTEYNLEQNYPNPFNPSTTIEFSIPVFSSNVVLSIYNVMGEKVAELFNKSFDVGSYQYNWNAENLASGIYFYELKASDFLEVKKMILIK